MIHMENKNEIDFATFIKNSLNNDEEKEKLAKYTMDDMLSRKNCIYRTYDDIILNDNVGAFSWLDPVKYTVSEEDIWKTAEKISITESMEEKYIIAACIMYLTKFSRDSSMHSLYSVLAMLGGADPSGFEELAEPLPDSDNFVMCIKINFNNTSRKTLLVAYNAVHKYILEHNVKH